MSSWQPFALALLFLSFVAQASVPASNTFTYVNEGKLEDYVAEYGATYRCTNIYTFPFQLCFYNTTPNAYTLAIGMGTPSSKSVMRWVWEANRGSPVGEGASFYLGTDGNLVLVHKYGAVVAWQSGTANIGVVGLKLLPNGNMVLHNSRGRYIWQSHDYPTDTLLIGQSIRAAGTNKLVSRYSEILNVNGPYFLELEAQALVLQSGIKIVLIVANAGTFEYVRFATQSRTNILRLFYKLVNPTSVGQLILASPQFNTTLSYLRLGIDGRLGAFTYDATTGSWMETFPINSPRQINYLSEY